MPTKGYIRSAIRRKAALPIVIGAGCLALASPVLAHAGSAASSPPSLDDDEIRLERIGYRLATANASRCDMSERQTGLTLQDVASYDPEFRAAAGRAHGFTYGFGIRRMVPGSSAERAGLLPGDEIVAVNGRDLRDFAQGMIGPRATHRRTESFVDFLGAALRMGPADLSVRRRGGAVMAISLAGDPACGGQFTVIRGNVLNAWSDGRYVAVTRKMMRFAQSDDELAFVVAHEMAHNMLGHNSGRRSSRLFTALGIGAGKIKADEIDADARAVELLAQAGFDLQAPERFLHNSRKQRWMDLPTTHPGVNRRIAIVTDAIARLRPAESAGAPDALVATGPSLHSAGRPAPGGLAMQPVSLDGASRHALLKPSVHWSNGILADRAEPSLARTLGTIGGVSFGPASGLLESLS